MTTLLLIHKILIDLDKMIDLKSILIFVAQWLRTTEVPSIIMQNVENNVK